MCKLILFLLIIIISHQAESEDTLNSTDKRHSNYRLIHEKLNWNDAFTVCQDVGHRLATIESSDEYRATAKYLQTETMEWENSTCIDPGLNDFQFWIAGQRLNLDKPKLRDNPFYWKLPEKLIKPLGYTNWAPREPDCAGEDGSCMEVTYSSGFKWIAARCSTQLCALCQIL